MSLKVKFSSAVYYGRTELGLTQEDLAEIIGKSPRSIQYIEKGVFLPKADTTLSLINFLNIDPKQFEEELDLFVPDHIAQKLKEKQQI